jgi:hypothetical protein
MVSEQIVHQKADDNPLENIIDVMELQGAGLGFVVVVQLLIFILSLGMLLLL